MGGSISLVMNFSVFHKIFTKEFFVAITVSGIFMF